jgi:hypothetical protein
MVLLPPAAVLVVVAVVEADPIILHTHFVALDLAVTVAVTMLEEVPCLKYRTRTPS